MYQRINRNSLGQFKRANERMIHVSAPIIRNPKAALAEALGKPFTGPQYVAARGTTYNIGRNKAKMLRSMA